MSRTVADALHDAGRQLEAGGIDGAARDARALVAAALEVGRDRLMLMRNEPVDPHGEQRLQRFVAARLARQPVSRIMGRRLFWGREFEVTPDVLDPRPETEVLIARALDRAPVRRILDLGTGSGILAVSLLAEWPGAQAVATDISQGALEVAARNARALGVGNRATFLSSDWWQAVEGSFDLIVSNPPYIPDGDVGDLAPEVRDWEPRQALTPGPEGLEAYRAIARGLDQHLAPGGQALLEFGAGQGPAVRDIFQLSDIFHVDLHSDLDGRPRIADVTRNA